MFSNLKVAAIGALFLGLVAAAGSSIAAGNVDTHTNYVTFSRSVGLPGVELAAGTYIFETPTNCDVELDRSRVEPGPEEGVPDGVHPPGRASEERPGQADHHAR